MKGPLKSKTLWVNALAAAVVALEINLHLLQPQLPVNVYLLIAVALPPINLLLRAVTREPLCWKKETP